MSATASPSSEAAAPGRCSLPGREAWLGPLRRAGVTRLGVLLGSFDPPHLGHEWMARHLLEHADAVLLLVPAVHYAKRVLPPHTATLGQRLEMLRLVAGRLPGTAVAGLTREVLFVRLERRLRRLLPGTDFAFGMGTDTYLRLPDSAAVAALLGVPWRPGDEAAVARLQATALVFGRRPDVVPDAVAVPPDLLAVSSTAVRRAVSRLRAVDAGRPAWRRELGGLVAEDVVDYLAGSRLYP